MDISYILNEYAEDRENYYRSVVPPIVQTSNFAFKTVEDLRKSFEDESLTYLYSRGLNPTIEILRKKLAALDGAEDCLVLNSGASAIFTAVLANVKSGDHIVSVGGVYSWARQMFENILPRFNVTHTYIDGTNIENFKKAMQPNTTVFYLESPNSWTYELQDLKAVAALAKQNNIITICDNSYCTPLYQRPLEFGIDLSLQSATKYIGGHSDTIAGVISGSKKMIERIFNSEYMNIGVQVPPFHAWLLIRGLRTLPARMERISKTTLEVLQFLKNHPMVDEVLFPFDKDFSQYKLAKQQMSGACGLLSFSIKADNIETLETFSNSLHSIIMAVSWGGYESLIVPGCASIKKSEFNKNNINHRRFRLYVGLEDASFIIGDLKQAFDKIKN